MILLLLIIVTFAEWDVNKIHPFQLEMLLDTGEMTPCLGFASKYFRDRLPWWRSGKESACQCRGHGFEPWSRKISHAAEQLSPCATTTEPVL